MTPTDTMTPIRPVPNNPSERCACGHQRRAHGTEDDHAVCFVCTHPHGGCRGFTTARETTDPTAGQRDAFLDGFGAGIHWNNNPHGITDPSEAGEHAWRRWVEGEGEDA